MLPFVLRFLLGGVMVAVVVFSFVLLILIIKIGLDDHTIYQAFEDERKRRLFKH